MCHHPRRHTALASAMATRLFSRRSSTTLLFGTPLHQESLLPQLGVERNQELARTIRQAFFRATSVTLSKAQAALYRHEAANRTDGSDPIASAANNECTLPVPSKATAPNLLFCSVAFGSLPTAGQPACCPPSIRRDAGHQYADARARFLCCVRRAFSTRAIECAALLADGIRSLMLRG